MQETKFCNRCNTDKLVSEFYRRGQILQAECKLCQGTRSKRRYIDNKEKYNVSSKKARRKYIETVRPIIQAAKNKPCADCDTKYPYYVMDFDHRDPSKKEFCIGRATAKTIKLEGILKEIEKCDVVCSNCHRERTYQRRSA